MGRSKLLKTLILLSMIVIMFLSLHFDTKVSISPTAVHGQRNTSKYHPNDMIEGLIRPIYVLASKDSVASAAPLPAERHYGNSSSDRSEGRSLDQDGIEVHNETTSAVVKHVIAPTPSPCNWLNRVGWKPGMDHHDYGYVINPVDKCNWTRNESTYTSVLILVSSGLANIERREAVRKTWLGWSVKKMLPTRTLFLLGASRDQGVMDAVYKEAEAHGDIIQEDFIDSYYNLTLKTVMAFKWAATFCNDADFVMKMDDDGVLNVGSLVRDLSLAPDDLRKDYFAGMRMAMDPIRQPGSKWCIPKSLFPADRYPPYPLGPGYIFSIDLARKLLEASRSITHFPIDDVFVGVLLEKLGIKLRHKSSLYLFTKSFHKRSFIRTEASLLALRKGYLTWNVSPQKAVILWDAILTNSWPDLNGESSCDVKCVEKAGYLP